MQFNIRNCYLRPGFTDLRRGMNGLMSVVMGEMDIDPLGGDLFLFCGRNHHTVYYQYRKELPHFPQKPQKRSFRALFKGLRNQVEYLQNPQPL